MADILPNETIYIKNLNSKVKKQEMKRALHALFSAYGRILDVVVCKTPKLRGQAWVVFNEIPAATSALRHMKEFQLFDRPMVIQYAKSKSDAIISLTDDSYAPKEKRRKTEDKGVDKKRKDQEQPQANGATPAHSHVYGAAPPPVKPGNQEPNSILFIQNLPDETTGPMLEMLFTRYPGLKDVRMVDGRPGIAFVEYSDEGQATVALEALQSFKITANHAMVISYAKKG
ncbi:hypothetical protein SELMODRAFT_236385 [Selaginella moellendorffii]|uniref:RRM domain-containing protein n=1 Tax=Selaginella moellendorffii TaxID=88036 RepID=D8T867_SELML|nr:U2 small nuclear ribonucleoprotein B'' [Selaginella moellendorffii]EFJ07198.1 hypothetical protein SELMODRAFT_236385 [Selaginella moellendorffii]|eukprot:XP_002991794.1 U2 small nuclear ribonucleoprotein B'' [Selaginella moellendorffii]